MVGITSAAIVQLADLAVGDILGSCVFNLAILAMLDATVKGNHPRRLQKNRHFERL
jgi:cation:H+ antiporter